MGFQFKFCLFFVGYGFVDFESPVAAEAAVKALANQGVQAQMAKVCYMPRVNLSTLTFSS